jgi:hypothetical protein
LARLENSSATLPTSVLSTQAPSASPEPSAAAARCAHQASGKAARSSAVEVKASPGWA